MIHFFYQINFFFLLTAILTVLITTTLPRIKYGEITPVLGLSSSVVSSYGVSCGGAVQSVFVPVTSYALATL